MKHPRMFPARIPIVAGLASLALLGAGCHRTVSPKKKVSAPPVVKDTARVVVTVKDTSHKDTARVLTVKDIGLKDTGLVTVFRAKTRKFDLQIAGQRDSFLALLKKERQLWQAGRPRDYRFLSRVGCFCPGPRGWLVIEVRGSEVRAWDRTGKSVRTDWDTISIDGLFDMLERSADRNDVVQIDFDPRWHFPTYIYTMGRPGPDMWGINEVRGLRAL